MNMRFITLLLVCLLGACADTTQFINNHQPQGHLRAESRIYVAVADDGAFGGNTYHGSGRTTSQIIYRALSQRSRNVRLGQQPAPYPDASTAAQTDAMRYLVFPTILHWEDRATEWNGMPDRVEVKIEVVDLQSGKTISSATVKGKSGWATLGGDHPQDLLPNPIAQWADSVFDAPQTGSMR